MQLGHLRLQASQLCLTGLSQLALACRRSLCCSSCYFGGIGCLGLCQPRVTLYSSHTLLLLRRRSRRRQMLLQAGSARVCGCQLGSSRRQSSLLCRLLASRLVPGCVQLLLQRRGIARLALQAGRRSVGWAGEIREGSVRASSIAAEGQHSLQCRTPISPAHPLPGTE